MSLNGVDPAAKTPGRIRRNWNRTIKGSGTSSLSVVQPIAIDGQGRLTLNVASAGGLSASGNAASVLLNGSVSGLALGTLGLSVSVDATTIVINASNHLTLGVITAKGDLIVGGNTGVPQRLASAFDGMVLTQDSTVPGGIKWAFPAASGVIKSGNVSLTLGTLSVTGATLTAAGGSGTLSITGGSAGVVTDGITSVTLGSLVLTGGGGSLSGNATVGTLNLAGGTGGTVVSGNVSISMGSLVIAGAGATLTGSGSVGTLTVGAGGGGVSTGLSTAFDRGFRGSF